MHINSFNLCADTLRQMTEEQFRYLGTRHVVYLKSDTRDGEPSITIYGADGTPLEVVDEWETAMETLARHGLGFVKVH